MIFAVAMIYALAGDGRHVVQYPVQYTLLLEHRF